MELIVAILFAFASVMNAYFYGHRVGYKSAKEFIEQIHPKVAVFEMVIKELEQTPNRVTGNRISLPTLELVYDGQRWVELTR